MTELESPLFRWIFELSAVSGDSPSQERFTQGAAALEAALNGHDWLVGDRFSVADVLCASVLGSAYSRELLSNWPGLEAYVERCQARPAFIAAATADQAPE